MIDRRQACAAFASMLAGSPLWSQTPRLAGEPQGRIAPVDELVNALEFEPMAQQKLTPARFAEIAGSERAFFDRITFMPNMMVNTTKLDMTVRLFGTPSYTPILVGPSAMQGRYHPDGELAMVRGASAANVFVVISSRCSVPIEQISAQSKTTLWFQADIETDIASTRARIERAVQAGCKAVCLTLADSVDWALIDSVRKGVTVPFLLKGILSPSEAREAMSHGVDGIIVSNYGLHSLGGTQPLEVLPEIAATVGGKTTVLMDGSIRRGSDVLKALALGAQAVLLGRPPLWGLAAYGADGVQGILQLIQAETARIMAQCGRPNIAAIDRTMVRIHRR